MQLLNLKTQGFTKFENIDLLNPFTLWKPRISLPWKAAENCKGLHELKVCTLNVQYRLTLASEDVRKT